jgi:ribosome assembly protein 1
MLRPPVQVISCEYIPFHIYQLSENSRLTVLSSLSEEQRSNHNDQLSRQAITIRDLSDKIVYAFQLATGQGPLCQEPVQGIAVVLEDIALHVERDDAIDFGRLTGEAIRIVRDSISQGFLDWSPRILLAMYSCEIQASSKLPARPLSYYLRY